MLTFFKHIAFSIYSPEFYTTLKEQSTWKSVRYYLGLALLVALVLGIAISAILVPTLSKIIKDALPVASSLYPKELVITIKSGSAASNVTEPYRIAMPESVKRELATEASTTIPANLAVIDTRHSFDSEQFSKFNTVMWVAKDGIAMLKDNFGGAYTSTFQKYGNDFVMTSEKYLAFVNKVASFSNILPGAASALSIITVLLWGIARMLYFLVAALLVYLLLKYRKIETSYGHAYRITLHATTVPILLNVIFTFVVGDLRALAVVPFLFTIILLIVVWFNTNPVSQIKNGG